MTNIAYDIMFSENGLNVIMTAQIGAETAETFRDEASVYEDEINQAIMHTRKTYSYANLGRMIDLLLDSDERNLYERIASGDLDDDEMM